MTDLEISKALALAIGYDEQHIHKGKSGACFVQRWNAARSFMYYHKFDYRDWNVIGPIAEKYECFPIRTKTDEWFANIWDQHGFTQTTHKRPSRWL